MKKKTVFISFSSQKGGVGKSTMTTLVASVMHYARGLNVAVIDCDYPQCSLEKLRERELKFVREDATYRNKAIEFSRVVHKQPYPIVSSKPEQALATAHDAFFQGEESDYDVIFFDMAGTINNTGMLRTYLEMDYVFAPMQPSRIVMESTLVFIAQVTNFIKENPPIRLKNIFMFWNRIDTRVKRTLMENYEKVIRTLGLHQLRTVIPQSVRFDREYMSDHKNGVFISSIMAPDSSLMAGSNIDVLTDEIIEIAGLKTASNEQTGRESL